MKASIKIIALITAVLTVFPLLCFNAFSEGEKNYTFIDGENIHRQNDSAVIYSGTDSITLNSRGYDVVLDSDGVVTEIFKGSLGSDRTITIPVGGAVVSAVGSANVWLKDSVKVGAKMVYDRYTQKLFLCNADGTFNPYFSESLTVTGENGDYTLSSEVSSKYKYTVTVNAEGIIIARGKSVSLPEGGFTVSAVTEADREKLVMYAIVGGKCTVADGIATFSYDKTMHKNSIDLALADANAEFEAAKSEFRDVDLDEAQSIITFAEQSAATDEFNDYLPTVSFIYACETEIRNACTADVPLELRGAFHTPDEKNESEVKATVASAKKAGLNSLILRVTNGYGTFIPLPDGNRFKQDDHFEGFDVLQSYIDVCKEENVALTLCIDVYFNEYAIVANRNWILENDDLDISGDSPEYESIFEGEYFSPASTEFKEYFLSYLDYIISNYKIESLMFDYLRYPKFSELTDLGYDNETLNRFSESIGKPISECYAIRQQTFESPLWRDWVNFKTSLIDDMARSISETVRSKRSDITLTAVAMSDTVDYYYMQNATDWIEDGIMDGLCMSFYERDDEENDPLPEMAYYSSMISEKSEIFANYTSNDKYLFTGLEIGKGFSKDSVVKAVTDSRKVGSDGFIFTDLRNYISQSGLDFSNSLMKKGAESPLGNKNEVMRSILEYAKNRIESNILPSGGCDQSTAESAYKEIDAKLTLIDEDKLTPELISELESNIAMIFASSPAKSAVLREFTALTKLSKLTKAEVEDITPPENNGEVSTVPDSESSTEDGSEEESKKDFPLFEESQGEDGVNVGSILIFLFVGIAMAASVACIVIFAIRKKETKPVNRHMKKNVDDSNLSE